MSASLLFYSGSLQGASCEGYSSICLLNGERGFAHARPPEKEASSPPPPLQLLLSVTALSLPSVRTLAAGEGVRGLEGADACFCSRRALLSDLHTGAAASLGPASPPLLLPLIICGTCACMHRLSLDVHGNGNGRHTLKEYMRHSKGGLAPLTHPEWCMRCKRGLAACGLRKQQSVTAHLAHDVLPDVAQLELTQRLLQHVRGAELYAAPDVVRAAALLAHEHQRQVRRALAQAPAIRRLLR